MPTGTKPPLPINVFRVAFEGVMDQCTWANVMYFRDNNAVTLTPAQAKDVGDSIGTAYANSFKPHLHNSWQLQREKWLYKPLTSESIKGVSVVTATGQQTSGGEEAGQVAVLINWSTFDPRRGGKPRTYLIGVPSEAMVSGGDLTTTYIANYNGDIAAFLTAIAAITTHGVSLELVDMSWVNGGAYRPAAVMYSIYGGSCNPTVGTQRRRVGRLRA